ncbi:kinase-like domain-containing protein [Mycena polygramma]|nr:kinase-like domain-containing protein [Mycena polygramma]
MEKPYAYVWGYMEESYEEDSRYGPGGLFPVRLGDILGPDPPRYRIAAKLGYGGYATVWLARDLIGERTVALKFIEAAASEGSNEAAVLERLRAPADTEPLVVQLLDSFTVKSPNGVHLVLVTEPLMMLETYLMLGLPSRTLTKAMMYQLIEGLAFMHARGIAHGDLHPRNIGVAIPELGAVSDIQLWEKAGNPEVMPVVAYSPTRDPASFPPYLVEVFNLGHFLKRHIPGFATRGPPRMRIFDFGNAYALDTSPPPPCTTPLLFRPPEVLFPRLLDRRSAEHWDCRSDIWSLACMFNDLVRGGRSLFSPSLGDKLLRSMARAGGGAPDAWLEHLSEPATEYTTAEADTFWAEVWVSDTLVEDAPGFLRLLRRMLVVDPAQRPTAEDLLLDPYFDGLQDPDVGGVLETTLEHMGLAI